MPFTAVEEKTKETVTILDVEDPRKTWPKGTIICKDCKKPMYVKGGTIRVQFHFAHFPKQADDSCYFVRVGESPLHLEAKEKIRDLLASMELYEDCVFEFEYPLTLPDGSVRYADIGVIFPHGEVEAHEAQLYYQAMDKLNERHEDHRKAGADTIWWFGGKANTEDARRWAIREIGVVGELSVYDSPATIASKKY
jgi:competence protein CoiA